MRGIILIKSCSLSWLDAIGYRTMQCLRGVLVA